MKLLNGHIQRSKKRLQIQLRRVYGKEHGAKIVAICNRFLGFLRIVRTYAGKEAKNAIELGLLYHQPFKWSLSSTTVSGFRKKKSRLIVFAASNNGGSKTFLLMIMDNAKWPRASNRKYGKDLVLGYFFNKKARMSNLLFTLRFVALTRTLAVHQARKYFFFLETAPLMSANPCFQIL